MGSYSVRSPSLGSRKHPAEASPVLVKRTDVSAPLSGGHEQSWTLTCQTHQDWHLLSQEEF